MTLNTSRARALRSPLLLIGLIALVRPGAAADAPPPGMRYIAGGESDEARIREFYLDRTEVTVAAFRRCVKAGVCLADGPATWLEGLDWAYNWNKPDRDEHPMNGVSYYAALAYCDWSGKRLPDEEEWEWAARSRDHGHRFAWGKNPPTGTEVNACGQECAERLARLPLVTAAEKRLFADARPMYPRADGFAGTAPVGSFARDATIDGVLDLGGNVAEWTMQNLTNLPVMRGGGWWTFKVGAMPVSWRAEATSGRGGLPSLGFRCARDIEADPTSDKLATVERLAGAGPVRISFASGAATLSPDQQQALKKFAAPVYLFPLISRVTIEGHTDNQLDDARSLALSGKRAQAVKAYLIDRGISKDRLVALGFGMTLPVADNGAPAGRTANNRVELHITEIGGKPRPREQTSANGTIFP